MLVFISENRLLRGPRCFVMSVATSLASVAASPSYLLSKASMVTARNRVRNVYLPTITHITKNAVAPHPAGYGQPDDARHVIHTHRKPSSLDEFDDMLRG